MIIPDFSVFDSIHAAFDLPILTLSLAGLTHITATLEEIVVSNRLPALVCAGGHAALRAQRDLNPFAYPLTLELPGEWFYLILCEQLSVVISGREVGENQYHVLWSMEPEIIHQALALIDRPVPERYRRYPFAAPDPKWMTQLTTQLLKYQAHLERDWQNATTERDQSEEKFDQVIASISHHIYVIAVTPRGEVSYRYLSPNTEELTGYPNQTLLDDPYFWKTGLIHPSDIAAATAQFNRLRQGIDSSMEYRLIKANGDVVWVQDSARARLDKNGDCIMYGVVNDITGKKLAEDAVRQQEILRLELEKERELNAIKSQFMSVVSHEFRTPLATILSSSEMMERYGTRLTSADGLNRLRIIRQQVTHLRSMLDDISTIIKAENGGMEFKPRPVDLLALCQQVIEDVKLATRATHPIHFTHEGDLARITSDERLLKHILSNLLVNAVKYSPRETDIHLDVSVQAHHIFLRVIDQGIGIPPHDLKHLFAPFQRGGNVGNIGGTGLGLKIVKDCVEIHRGTITVDSAEGLGSTFTVSLPLLV